MGFRHYIMTDGQDRVIDGFSTGEHPGLGPTEGMLLLTDDGAERFPYAPLRTADQDAIPRYLYEYGGVRLRTEAEIDADRPGPQPEPEPTELERLRADVDYIMAMEGLL